MTSLASRYYEFILAQGVLFGIACGMIFTPVVSIVGQDFTTRRALAMGVVPSGASVGGIIFPVVLNHLLNGTSLGIGWAIRIVGFMMLGFMILACAVVKENLPHRKHRFYIIEAFPSRAYVLTFLGFSFSLFGF